MALPSDQLTSGGKEKGKAVFISHVWKDFLWEMGSKPDSIPEDKAVQPGGSSEEASQEEPDSDNEHSDRPQEPEATPPPPSEEADPSTGDLVSYSSQEVNELLQKSLLQAIASTLSSATFPIPATLFYTNYILPSRPAFPTLVLAPAAHPEDLDKLRADPQEITIKASTHKSLTAFLKASDKLGLLTLKQPQKHSQQTDSLVMSINAKSPLVLSHVSFPTVRDIEMKAAKKAAREEKAAEGIQELGIRELWKPHLVTADLFKGLGGR